MLFKSRTLLLSAMLLAAPLATAMAQQNNPTGNMGSNRSTTAAPGTADSAASTMHTGDNATRGTMTNSYGGGTSMNNTAPGATGHTVVPGTTSSQAGAAGSTVREKSGPGASGSGGGSR